MHYGEISSRDRLVPETAVTSAVIYLQSVARSEVDLLLICFSIFFRVRLEEAAIDAGPSPCHRT